MKKLLNITGWVIASILSSMVIIHLSLMLFGYKSMVVISGSMEPDIKVGSIIYVKKIDADEVYEKIEVGDYITFKMSNGSNATHEVIYMNEEEDKIQTQGIREGAALDEAISSRDVVGKFSFTISYLGYVLNFIGNKFVIITFFGVVACIFVSTTLVKELKKKDEEK